MYKKIYLYGVGVLCVLLAVFGGLWVVQNKNKSLINSYEEKEEINEGYATKDELSESNEQYIKYVNSKYGYEITFPEDWYINNDYSESDTSLHDDANISFGGQTFWSNYSDINKFSPSNHPKDFHLLALTIYRDNSQSIDDFAEKLDYESESQKIDFQVEEMIGKEMISAGLLKGNPRIAIIFKKEDLFYVFNLGFVTGDANVTESMEEIVKTFKVNEK